MVGRLDEELQQAHGVSFAEYDVLLRLAHAPRGVLRMGDHAERVLLSPSGITRLVERLVARGHWNDPRPAPSVHGRGR